MRTMCYRCGFYHFNENDHIVDRDGPLPYVEPYGGPFVEIDDRVLAIYYRKQLEAFRRA